MRLAPLYRNALLLTGLLLSGCFARFDEPAVNGDSPDSPFDPRQPSSLYIP
ncbi:hypothetical protein ACUODJ_53460, partial [Escherichia sp. HC-CC]